MKLTCRTSLAVLLFLIMAGCAHQTVTPKQYEAVTFPGTGDSQDLLRAVAKSYTQEFPERAVFIPDSVSSSGGIKAVGTGTAAIGRVARLPLPKERAAYGEFKYEEFARVPVVFVVSTNVGVANLSEAQICGIYSGQITNWREVGGKDMPIQAQTRPEGGSNLILIRKHLSCFTDLKFGPDVRDNFRNSDLVNTMQTTPSALGFMPLSEAMFNGIKSVSLNGVEPLDKNYKLGIGLGFVYKKTPSPSARAFLDYLATKRAKKIMKDTGHVPLL